MTHGESTLVYPIRAAVLLKYLGQIGVVLALLLLPPLAVALAGRELTLAAVLATLAVAVGLAGWRLNRINAPAAIRGSEALAVTALAFVLAALVISVPMAVAGLPPGEAVFEAVSAVTTTGLTMIASPESVSGSLLFLRAWGQWFGGLGIIVLSVALTLGHPVASRALTQPMDEENLPVSARTWSRQVLLAYSTVTLAGILLLWLVVPDLDTAILHGLAAISTGGFSSVDAGAAGLGRWPARLVLLGIAFAGAMPVALYALGRHRHARLLADIEVRTLAVACLVTVLLLWLTLDDGSWLDALFMGVSAQTTTGFHTVDVATMSPAAKVVLLGSMAIGGASGSSAGGIKLLRLLIALRVLQLMLRQVAMPPHAVAASRLAGRVLEHQEIQRALLLFVLFAAATLLSWLVFVVCGAPPLDGLFEVVSALGTVGLSTGLTSPELPGLLKGVLCLDMLLGRVEIVAVLILLYPRTWRSPS